MKKEAQRRIRSDGEEEVEIILSVNFTKPVSAAECYLAKWVPLMAVVFTFSAVETHQHNIVIALMQRCDLK